MKQFILNFQLERGSDYFEWLFNYLSIGSFLTFSLALLGTGVLAAQKRWSALVVSLFCWVPFLLLLLNEYHSHDFRYISYIMPFAIMLSMFSVREILAQLLQKQAGARFILFAVGLLLVILARPSFPGVEVPGVAIKAQADWTGTDGDRIHRRAVAPDYRTAYEWLNKSAVPGDTVILIDGAAYLQPVEGVTYLALDPWTGTDTLQNISTLELVQFEDLILSRQGNLFLVGAYMHYVHPNILQFLTTQCHNMSSDLGIFSYEYNAFYRGKNLYWPNAFYCGL